MAPKLSGIDHVHIYVTDRDEATAWYQSILGFRVVEKLQEWAVDNGPVTLETEDGAIHVALFQRENSPPGSAVAFGASADEFMAWKEHLQRSGVDLRISDHRLAFSMYFEDPYGNLHEITTYEHGRVERGLAA